MPVKRWNFHKAKWSHYIALTNKFEKTLLPPDSFDVDAVYQGFFHSTMKAAKTTSYALIETTIFRVECKVNILIHNVPVIYLGIYFG